MTGRRRFCVLFANDEWPGQRQKTRLLHSDSTREDLIQIWNQVYQQEIDPKGAEIYLNENCAYRLDDDDDIAAFLVQAEDQYNLLPAYPMQVKLVNSRRREKKPVVGLSTKVLEERASNQLQTKVKNNTDQHVKDEYMPPSPESLSALSPARSLMMLSQSQNQTSPKELQASNVSFIDETCQNVDLVTGSVANSSTLGKHSHLSGTELYINSGSSIGNGPPATYSKPLSGTSLVPSVFAVHGDKETRTNMDGASSHLSQPECSLPSMYSTMYKNLQEQSLAHRNRNALFLWQAFINSQFWANAQRQDLNHARASSSLPLHDTLPVSSSFAAAQHSFLSKDSSLHETRMVESSPLMSSVAEYNSKSALNYTNGSVFQALQNYTNIKEMKDLSGVPQKKRKRSGRGIGVGKSTTVAKRMRSTVSKSNIETHHQLAIAYSQMSEEEKKRQNSAHRSHWKHLLFVAQVSPGFVQKFRYAKYDEWSSETRDIYAMCLPDHYMWSFLTLSKQGHLLCERIMGRIDGLLNKKPEERPDWCPEEEILQKAKMKAAARLEQLQRILQSRSTDPKAGSAKNKARELKRPSAKEQRAALMKAFIQRQHASGQRGHDAKIMNSMREKTQTNAIPMPMSTALATSGEIGYSSGHSSKSVTSPQSGCPSSNIIAFPQIGRSPGATSKSFVSPQIVCPSGASRSAASPRCQGSYPSAPSGSSESSSSLDEQHGGGQVEHSKPRSRSAVPAASLAVTV